jgi:hypothetical protein
MTALGQKAVLTAGQGDCRSTANNGHGATTAACRFGANSRSSVSSCPSRLRAESDWQACLEEASLLTLAVHFALVVVGSEIDCHRELRLELQDLSRVRGCRGSIAHLRKGGCEESMMGVVRPRDPRKGFDSFCVPRGTIACTAEIA